MARLFVNRFARTEWVVIVANMLCPWILYSALRTAKSSNWMDFTWGAATAPSYMKKSMLGKLTELLEKEKCSAYADRCLHNTSAPDLGKMDFIPLACVQPINGANRSRTLLKKSRSESLQARKAMIQCKKVRSIVLECKFIGFSGSGSSPRR